MALYSTVTWHFINVSLKVIFNSFNSANIHIKAWYQKHNWPVSNSTIINVLQICIGQLTSMLPYIIVTVLVTYYNNVTPCWNRQNPRILQFWIRVIHLLSSHYFTTGILYISVQVPARSWLVSNLMLSRKTMKAFQLSKYPMNLEQLITQN